MKKNIPNNINLDSKLIDIINTLKLRFNNNLLPYTDLPYTEILKGIGQQQVIAYLEDTYNVLTTNKEEDL